MPGLLPSRIGLIGASVALVLLISIEGRVAMAQDHALNTLTDEEKAQGWTLLFDGKSLHGWRGFKSETPPAGWKALDGLLVRESDSGDLMTVDQYGDFELRLEWRISKNGNSGIMFRVTTEAGETYETGPEFQILDNAGHKDGKNPMTSAGSNYAMHAPVRDVTKPVGEWNDVRLVVKGPHVEHWMNSVKLLEYELWSPDWEALVQASKFKTMPGYGRARRGYIVLQDHGDVVAYRNIKIKPL